LSARCPVQHAYIIAYCHVITFDHLGGTAVMESTPPTSKRIKTRIVRSERRLEGWFLGDNELIERYRFETNTKVINNPKVVSFDW